MAFKIVQDLRLASAIRTDNPARARSAIERGADPVVAGFFPLNRAYDGLRFPKAIAEGKLRVARELKPRQTESLPITRKTFTTLESYITWAVEDAIIKGRARIVGILDIFHNKAEGTAKYVVAINPTKKGSAIPTRLVVRVAPGPCSPIKDALRPHTG